MKTAWLYLALVMLVMSAAPVQAEIREQSESGFTVSFAHKVMASPDQVWAALAQPSRWWSGEHSWSGDAKNFSLEPVAGGCFCERWGANSVEHARVIFAMKDQQLRMSGAFGPLQGEALTGTLTITLKAEGRVTMISADYVVGGHARFAFKDVAPAVDGVLGAQMTALAALFPAAP